MEEKTCCVTGPRNIGADKVEYVKQELRNEILQAINDGYTHYISGFSEGVDLWFAEIVLKLKKENPTLTLEAAIPYRKRLLLLFENSFAKEILFQCHIIGVYCEEYNRHCFMNRNRFIVRNSSRLIAVYDRQSRDGTMFTIRAAAMMERDARIIEI